MHPQKALVWMAIPAIALLIAACGGDDDDDSNSTPEATAPGATATSAANGGGSSGDRGGTVTIGDESWTLVPSIQCGIFPGPMVAIAGHASEDSDIEIVIDYDDESDLKGVRVQGADDEPYWTAQDDDLNYEIDGRTVRFDGTFRDFSTGETAEGELEVSC